MPNRNFVFIYSKGIELSPIENMKNMAVHLLDFNEHFHS